MLAVQNALEKGHFQGRLAHLASSAWARIASRTIVKNLHVPARVRLVCVGGATLGGSGKTPIAIALARRERERGERVALVGHAYRGRPLHARSVHPDDDAFAVGDEAVAAATDLAGIADVVVAPTRQAAIDFAITRGATCLVIDGVQQTAPRRADLSVLAIDSASRRMTVCPPAGDLRAPLEALLAHADLAIEIADDDAPSPFGFRRARAVSDGLRAPDGTVIGYETLVGKKIGLALAIAHPERIETRLAQRGITPVARAYVADHMGARLRELMQRVSRSHTDIDAWVTTSKCAAFVRPQCNDALPAYVALHNVDLGRALP
ncbi:MAG: tetraacyldisaccharide 4'-kinase [Polyangiaceae bacterium]